MPSKPQRPCSKVGCPNLTREKYCEDHKQLGVRQSPKYDANKRKQYDKKIGSATKRGYDAKWRKYREEYLKKHPQCKMCGGKATVIDHIIPVRDNPGLFYTPFNHQPLCAACHARKTNKFDGGLGHDKYNGIR